MIKTLILLIAISPLLASCGYFNRAGAKLTGYSTFCVSETRIKYVQGPTGMAPLYNLNGALVACEK